MECATILSLPSKLPAKKAETNSADPDQTACE